MLYLGELIIREPLGTQVLCDFGTHLRSGRLAHRVACEFAQF